MTPASYRIASTSLVELVPSVFSLHSVNSSHLQLILSTYLIGKFQTPSVSPHLLFFQPWRVPIYYLYMESQPTDLLFFFLYIYIILYFFNKINLYYLLPISTLKLPYRSLLLSQDSSYRSQWSLGGYSLLTAPTCSVLILLRLLRIRTSINNFHFRLVS